MSKVAAILGVCFGFLLVLSSGPVSAQTSKRPARAIKFDEFGKLGHCDVTARLDNFALQLQNQPSATGVIVTYAPEGEGQGTGKRVLEVIRDYLVNRGVVPDRIETIYGGRNSDLYQSHTELWVVEKGARLPKTQKRETNVDTFHGLYVDFEPYDSFGVEVVEEMGPGIGNSTGASFADILHQQKNAVGYVVVYSGEDLTPGAWRRLGQDVIDGFKDFNLEANRFKLIFGGQEKKSHMQYWITPSGAPPPVAEAGSEKPLAKTIKVGEFYNYYLPEKNQAAIFSRLSEILTLDKTVRAFLVVHLEQPEPEEPAESTTPLVVQPFVQLPEPTEPVEPVEEEPPVDLTKLVEKWRADMANTHKIGPDRLIVVFTTDTSSYLSLWIVPKGAPLPNPNGDEEEPAESKDDPGAKP